MARPKIKIKPSKRGTFTAAAKSRGKTVQGFASTVLANKENYSPAMVKKANFARNASKWRKQFGGYLDQELNTIPIENTPIDQSLVAPTVFAAGGELPQWLYEARGDQFARGGQLPKGKALTAARKRAGGSNVGKKRKTSAAGKGPFVGPSGGAPKGSYPVTNKKQWAAAKSYARHAPNPSGIRAAADRIARKKGWLQEGGGLPGGGGSNATFNPPLMVPLTSGQIGQGVGGAGGVGAGGTGTGGAFGMEGFEDFDFPSEVLEGMESSGSGVGGIGGMMGEMGGEEPSLQKLLGQNPGLEEIMPDMMSFGSLGFQDGGSLPKYQVGSWLGTVGNLASAIPVVGQIAGPILKTVGAMKQQEEAEEEAREAAILQQKRRSFVEGQREKQMQEMGARARASQPYQFGGGLTEENFQQPVITEYDGGSNTHQQGIGGVPVDSRGNPATVSKQSAVGMTEKGEVTWNGYVFSDNLKIS